MVNRKKLKSKNAKEIKLQKRAEQQGNANAHYLQELINKDPSPEAQLIPHPFMAPEVHPDVARLGYDNTMTPTFTLPSHHDNPRKTTNMNFFTLRKI